MSEAVPQTWDEFVKQNQLERAFPNEVLKNMQQEITDDLGKQNLTFREALTPQHYAKFDSIVDEKLNRVLEKEFQLKHTPRIDTPEPDFTLAQHLKTQNPKAQNLKSVPWAQFDLAASTLREIERLRDSCIDRMNKAGEFNPNLAQQAVQADLILRMYNKMKMGGPKPGEGGKKLEQEYQYQPMMKLKPSGM